MAISNVIQFKYTVQPCDIDNLHHVNNQVYLKWFMHGAEKHSDLIGWTFDKMIAGGEGWVVRKTEIEYLSQLLLGQEILLRTWVETAEKASSERRYEVVRVSDKKMVTRGMTLWVWLNYKKFRPARIPQELIEDFVKYDPGGPIDLF